MIKPYFKSGIAHYHHPSFQLDLRYVFFREEAHRLFFELTLWKWRTVAGVSIEK